MNDKNIMTASTGVKGLDDVLRGGFPKNRFFVVEGRPGTGKTTLALQFLLEGAKQGEKVLYITLSETREELDGVAESHDMSLAKLSIFELSALEERLAIESQNTLFHPAEVELTKTTQILLQEVEKLRPSRVVLDSLSELRLLAQNSLRFRRQLLALKQFFSQLDCTVLFLDDMTSDNADLQIQSIAHGVLHLEQLSPEYGAERRRLNVRKLRGVAFRGGYHDYSIRKGGLIVFPRLVAAEHRMTPETGFIKSGVDGLDRLLGDGIDQGTSTLILGPSGAGKSTLALQYAVSLAEQNQKTAFFTFDENLASILKRSSSLGLPLPELVQKGKVMIKQVDPAELSPGELVQKIREAVEEDGVKLLVIDSLNGYLNAMPDERHLTIQLHELLTFLNQKGIASLLLFAQHGMFGQMRSPIDLTYLSDTVILLRNFEFRGSVRKAISVIKKRTGWHEDTIREMSIDRGIKVGDPLRNFHGVLSGTPTYIPGDEERPV